MDGYDIEGDKRHDSDPQQVVRVYILCLVNTIYLLSGIPAPMLKSGPIPRRKCSDGLIKRFGGG